METFSVSLTLCGFASQRVSSVRLWCFLFFAYTSNWTVELPVIWDTMKLWGVTNEWPRDMENAVLRCVLGYEIFPSTPPCYLRFLCDLIAIKSNYIYIELLSLMCAVTRTKHATLDAFNKNNAVYPIKYAHSCGFTSDLESREVLSLPVSVCPSICLFFCPSGCLYVWVSLSARYTIMYQWIFFWSSETWLVY